MIIFDNNQLFPITVILLVLCACHKGLPVFERIGEGDFIIIISLVPEVLSSEVLSSELG